MGNYNVTITNEGAALLASVIANQGTITFTEARLSEINYVGHEQTLTKNTFLGTFKTTTVAASVTSYTQITLQASFSNSGTTEPHDMYSVGIIGTDGNTTALVCVLTTSNPDNVEPTSNNGSGSYYAFKTLLTVSSTSDITVIGTTAAVLYDTDVVDNLTSTAVNKPLSANMGRVLNEQSSAVTNVYGAKNLARYPYDYSTFTLNGITFTDNGDGTITVSGTASADASMNIIERAAIYNPLHLDARTYIVSGCPSGGSENTYYLVATSDAYISTEGYKDIGEGKEFSVTAGVSDAWRWGLTIVVKSGTVISTPITFKPMLYDARILDPTYAPFAETNLQLTKKTSGLSNENLVDNPWFTVNQRGATTITSGYGADRWLFIEGTSATYSSNGVSLNNSFICQILENQLPNGLYTASVMYQNGTIEYGTAIKADNSTVITFFTSSTGFKLMYTPLAKRFDVNGKNGSTTAIRAVKLELGSKSTLAHDVAPNYTAELLKCQRYLAPAGWCVVTKNSNNIYVGTVKLPVPLYGVPTIPTPTLTNALWCPGSGYVTPESVSTNIRDIYKTIVSFTFAGSALTEPCYVYDSCVLVNSEL